MRFSLVQNELIFMINIILDFCPVELSRLKFNISPGPNPSDILENSLFTKIEPPFIMQHAKL